MLIRRVKFNYLINSVMAPTLNSNHEMNILISNEIENSVETKIFGKGGRTCISFLHQNIRSIQNYNFKFL